MPYRYLATLAFSVLVLTAGCRKSPSGLYSGGAGQIPASNDKDGDGVPDDWEINGVDYTYPPDGSKHHLDLKKDYGASPNHKDIFVWIAWMESPTHTHKPEPQAISIVTQAFKLAPVQNIDGYPGINLHVILAPEPIPEKQMLGSNLPGGNYDWSEYDALKKKYFPPELEGVFHFCLFAHDFDPTQYSGITKDIPGRDFIVSLGGFTNMVGTIQEKAGTFMHELGHALGLRHGGSDDINYKPVYVSVMNYSFQLNGIPINEVQGNYDYSRFKLDCSESKLNKTMPLTSDPSLTKYGTQYSCGTNPIITHDIPSITGTPVDWNCSGNLIPNIVAADINGDQQISDLAGLADWQNIVLKPRTVASSGIGPHSVTGTRAKELTPQQADAVRLFPVAHVTAVRTGPNIFVSWNQIPLDRVLAYRVYRSAGSSSPELIKTIDDTVHPTFTDTNVKPGAYQYFVTAVFAPHSFAIQQGDEKFPVPVTNTFVWPNTSTKGVKWNAHWGLNTTREIGNAGEIAGIRDAAATKASHYENLGQAAPQVRASFGLFPKTLYETSPSAGAGIIITR